MPLIYLLLFSILPFLSNARLVRHSLSFSPTHILRATAQNISIDCESRYSVVLNGTSPGPTIHLLENQTSWIRVYNDMTDLNLTVVRRPSDAWYLPLTIARSSTGMVWLKRRLHSPMDPLKWANGLFLLFISSTMRSALILEMLDLISTIRMLASKLLPPLVL